MELFIDEKHSLKKMNGISYVDKEEAYFRLESIKKEIEDEYARNGDNPSDEFIDSFSERYKLDV